MMFSITRILYEYWNQDELFTDKDGNTYNDEYDKPLGVFNFDNMKQAINFVKHNIKKKGYNINEIDDLSTDTDQEIIIFYGKDIIKDGIRFERAIRILNNDNIAVESTLKSLLFNGA